MSDERRKRVGVRFDRVPSAIQAQVDRYVFSRMQRRARARSRGDERRVAPRLEIGVAERLTASWAQPGPMGALSKPAAAARPCQLVDLSTTGCCLACDAGDPLKTGDRFLLRLESDELKVELPARVIWVKVP